MLWGCSSHEGSKQDVKVDMDSSATIDIKSVSITKYNGKQKHFWFSDATASEYAAAAVNDRYSWLHVCERSQNMNVVLP